MPPNLNQIPRVIFTDKQIAAEVRHYNPATNKLGGIAHQLIAERDLLREALRYYRAADFLTTDQQKVAENALLAKATL